MRIGPPLRNEERRASGSTSPQLSLLRSVECLKRGVIFVRYGIALHASLCKRKSEHVQLRKHEREVAGFCGEIRSTLPASAFPDRRGGAPS